jgi:hypothetical protein
VRCYLRWPWQGEWIYHDGYKLGSEIVKRSIPSKEFWWGYDCIQIDDPDGNELLFPLPKDLEVTR